jgi:hypothetical protein
MADTVRGIGSVGLASLLPAQRTLTALLDDAPTLDSPMTTTRDPGPIRIEPLDLGDTLAEQIRRATEVNEQFRRQRHLPPLDAAISNRAPRGAVETIERESGEHPV